MTVFRLLVLAVLVVGCGKPSLEASCRRAGSAQCKKMFECARAAAELQYSNEANCVSQYNGICEIFRNYECDDLSGYERCINDVGAPGCSSLQPASCSGGSNLTGTCRLTNTGGRATCTNTNTNNTGSGCTVTLSQCSDGRAYTMSCTSGGSCTCTDGSMSRSVFGTCSDRGSAIATCGWNVQP